MDWLKTNSKGVEILKKYKFVVLIFLLGIVLMLIPNHMNTNEDTEALIPDQQPKISLDEDLEKVLSLIQGAGKVEVLLAVASGEETQFQTNDKEGSMNTTTVIVTDAARNQQGLVKQINPPIYKGAVIVCQGADKPAVCLAITEAVSKITGLGSDRIVVVKMK